jgi:hypothetical protein
MINTHSNNSNNAEERERERRYKIPAGSKLLKLGNQLFPGMNCEFTEHELKQFMLQICGNDMERAEEGANTILETCAPYEVTD